MKTKVNSPVFTNVRIAPRWAIIPPFKYGMLISFDVPANTNNGMIIIQHFKPLPSLN